MTDTWLQGWRYCVYIPKPMGKYQSDGRCFGLKPSNFPLHSLSLSLDVKWRGPSYLPWCKVALLPTCSAVIYEMWWAQLGIRHFLLAICRRNAETWCDRYPIRIVRQIIILTSWDAVLESVIWFCLFCFPPLVYDVVVLHTKEKSKHCQFIVSPKKK